MSFWNLKKKTENKLRPVHSAWKIGLSARKPFKDSDKDKVIDIFDCQPKNRRKQGFEHEEKSKKEKLEKMRREALVQTTKGDAAQSLGMTRDEFDDAYADMFGYE